jgi:hypothetical protein
MTTPDRVRRVKDQRVLSPGAAVWVLRAAAVVFVVATVDAALDPAAALDAWLVVASFAVLIGMGEYYRFGIEDGRQLAPMTLATGLAFALTSRAWQTDLTDLGPGPIIMVSALAMTAGALLHVVRRRTVRSEEVAARFLAICVTAIIFRWTPVWSGRTLLDVDEDWVGGRWPVALFLAAVAAVGLFTFLAISALVVAARSATSFRQALLDEVRSSAGLSLALSATGALIALAERPLGVVALPLFLVPLVLTQFALRQYAAIRRTYAQTVRVLSRLTEVGGFTRAGHPDRVAELCVQVGRDLGLSGRDVRNLEYAALLHDIGQVALRAPIPAGATLMAAPADQRRIAADSAEIVRKTGLPPEVASAVEFQATPYRVVREQRQNVPMLSRIVKVVNAYDDLVGGSIAARRREAAVERIHLGLGYEYDPRVVAALVRVLGRQTTGL